jgi:Ca2+-binding RTX toxin-like protein
MAVSFENVIGGAGNDQLIGNQFANQLEGGGGGDTLTGGAGNDLLFGGTGDDVYLFLAATVLETDTVREQLNEGVDRFDFSTLSATVPVTADLANDTLLATHTNRTINTFAAGQALNIENVTGGAGNDVLLGNSASNRLDGGLGNDTLRGLLGDDMLTGGTGSDLLDGGDGNDTYLFQAVAGIVAETDTLTEAANSGIDTLDFSVLAATIAVTVDLGSDASLARHTNRVLVANSGQSANFENAAGGAGNDSLLGNALANRLLGGAGNDTVSGGTGDDMLDGGLGTDELRQTSSDAQTLTNSSLTGLGTDTIGGFERVVLTGDATSNLIDARQFTAGTVTLTGLGGNDTLFGGSLIDSLMGGEGADSINGGGGSDFLVGGSGNDVYFFSTATAAETDTITELGGISEGIDTVEFAAITTPVMIDLTKDAAIATHALRTVKATTGQAVNLENATGGSGNDTITGNAGGNRLEGRGGADVLTGGLGNDALLGGLDDDRYVFATLAGAAEADIVTELAGEGTDTLDFAALTATVAVTVNLASDASLATHANRTIAAPAGLAANLEQVIGGAGADTLTGNDAANLLDGAAGNDSLNGELGNDTLRGGVGDDAIRGGAGNDVLDGGLGNDALAGQAGNDTLLGQAGNDTLSGGSDNDSLLGGADNDTLIGGFGVDVVNGELGSDRALGGQGKSGAPRFGNSIRDLGDAITAEIIDELFATAYPFE